MRDIEKIQHRSRWRSVVVGKSADTDVHVVLMATAVCPSARSAELPSGLVNLLIRLTTSPRPSGSADRPGEGGRDHNPRNSAPWAQRHRPPLLLCRRSQLLDALGVFLKCNFRPLATSGVALRAVAGRGGFLVLRFESIPRSCGERRDWLLHESNPHCQPSEPLLTRGRPATLPVHRLSPELQGHLHLCSTSSPPQRPPVFRVS